LSAGARDVDDARYSAGCRLCDGGRRDRQRQQQQNYAGSHGPDLSRARRWNTCTGVAKELSGHERVVDSATLRLIARAISWRVVQAKRQHKTTRRIVSMAAKTHVQRTARVALPRIRGEFSECARRRDARTLDKEDDGARDLHEDVGRCAETEGRRQSVEA
jgi:hypothetical protein